MVEFDIDSSGMPYTRSRYQPAYCNTLPYMLCLSVTRRVLVSLLNASSMSTRHARSLTRMYPLTKHAFHRCQASITRHKAQIDSGVRWQGIVECDGGMGSHNGGIACWHSSGIRWWNFDVDGGIRWWYSIVIVEYDGGIR